MDLKLTAEQVETLIQGGVTSTRGRLRVEEVRENYARVRLPFRESMLRPGNVVSGPALFTAADTAMYALVLSHVGPELMAVTSNLNINFLAKAKAGDVVAIATALKFGRRLVVMEVSLYTADAPQRVAHVTGSYARPV
jgi:uncharacterized protein (TIGR00369 family)